jgi:hypothetical protein
LRDAVQAIGSVARGAARRERLTQADALAVDGQYEQVSRMVAEIGRLLGGWMRQVKKP